jgi:RNA ligase
MRAQVNTMKNLNSLFIEHNLFDRTTLEQYCERHLVRLRMSEKYPHLGILHYVDEAVYGKKWTDFTKACRGVIVDFNNKKLLSRPYDKFFNLGEPEAPSISELEGKSFWATEKLDGSMIILYWDETTKQFITTTKGSLDSEQGQYANSLIPSSVRDVTLVQTHTLQFELISSRYQIVVPYDKLSGYDEGLYLIGVRHNMSEKVFNPIEVQAFAKQYGLKMYKTSTFSSIEAAVDNVKGLPYTEEGFVLVFEDGSMLKIKGKEYLRVHRFIGSLSDSNLLDLMILGEDKNVLENLGSVPEEYRDEVIDTFAKYKKEALDFRKQCYTYFSEAPRDDRKTFALHVNSKVPGEYKGFLFKLFENKDPELPAIYSVFRKR